MARKIGKTEITNQILYNEIQEIKQNQIDMLKVSAEDRTKMKALAIYSKNHHEDINILKEGYKDIEVTIRENEKCIGEISRKQNECLHNHEVDRTEKNIETKQIKKEYRGFLYASFGGIIVAVVNWILTNLPNS